MAILKVHDCGEGKEFYTPLSKTIGEEDSIGQLLKNKFAVNKEMTLSEMMKKVLLGRNNFTEFLEDNKENVTNTAGIESILTSIENCGVDKFFAENMETLKSSSYDFGNIILPAISVVDIINFNKNSEILKDGFSFIVPDKNGETGTTKECTITGEVNTFSKIMARENLTVEELTQSLNELNDEDAKIFKLNSEVILYIINPKNYHYPKSLATTAFENYFLGLAKSGIQSAIDNMERYTHTIVSGDTLETIAMFDYKVKNIEGDENNEVIRKSVIDTFQLSTEDLAVVEKEGPIEPGKTINIPVNVSAEKIVKANLNNNEIVSGGVVITSGYTTESGDTFDSIAQKTNLSISELADIIKTESNILVEGKKIIIPNVPVVALNKLMSNIKDVDHSNIAGMVSSYMLSGQRLPKPGTDAEPFNPTETESIFSLTGQQFDYDSESTESFTLKNESNKEWISFTNGTEEGLEVDLKKPEHAEYLEFLESFNFNPETTVKRLPLFKYIPENYALSQKYSWDFPVSTDNFNCVSMIANNAVKTLDIWTLPAAIREKIKNRSLGDKLFYELKKSCHDEDAESNKPVDVNAYCYATLIDLNVRPIKEADNHAGVTYLLEGTDNRGFKILDDIEDYLGINEESEDNEEKTGKLFVVYETENGFVTEKDAEFSILKTNLSSDCDKFSQKDFNLEKYIAGLSADGNSTENFVKLLFDCSKVKTGGYYFNYKSEGKGFPKDLFADGGNGRIKLLIMFDDQNKNINRTLLPFNNCALVGDNIDNESYTLSIQPLVHEIGNSDKTFDDVLSNDEYNAIAETYIDFLNSDYLDEVNSEIEGLFDENNKLKPGRFVQFSKGALHKVSTVPQGHMAFEVERTKPGDSADIIKLKTVEESHFKVVLSENLKDCKLHDSNGSFENENKKYIYNTSGHFATAVFSDGYTVANFDDLHLKLAQPVNVKYTIDKYDADGNITSEEKTGSIFVNSETNTLSKLKTHFCELHPELVNICTAENIMIQNNSLVFHGNQQIIATKDLSSRYYYEEIPTVSGVITKIGVTVEDFFTKYPNSKVVSENEFLVEFGQLTITVAPRTASFSEFSIFLKNKIIDFGDLAEKHSINLHMLEFSIKDNEDNDSPFNSSNKGLPIYPIEYKEEGNTTGENHE